MPLLSVVTPVFNDARWLPEMLESVRKQTLQDWEHILVDDGSTDGSIGLIEKAAAADPRIRLLQMPENGGPGRARNQGVIAAKGRYVAFLDADDLWLPRKLERCLNWMQAHGYIFAYHDYRQISQDGAKIGALVKGPERLDLHTLHTRRGTGCLSVVIDRAGAPGVHFSEDRSLPEDFAAWLWLIRQGHVGHRLPEDLGRYRLRKSSRSANKRWAAGAIWRIYRDVECLPFTQAMSWWTQYAWHGFWLHRLARPRQTVANLQKEVAWRS